MINLLPGWALDGGLAALLERIARPEVRRRLCAECVLPDGRWQTPSGVVSWEEVLIATSSDPTHAGHAIADLARQLGQDPTTVMLDLIQREAGAVTMVRFNQSEENVVKALRHPAVMVGSDSIALTAGPGPHPGRPHPRTYGTFPRVLGVYVRERGVLTWELAVHKMTGLPAARLGLRDRGLLRPHAFADLAIIDPTTVRDEATFSEPHQHPRGIPYVVVNGHVIIDRGIAQPAPAGRVLTAAEERPRDR